MFPYLEQPAIALGPFTIHGFGVLAAAGISVGYFLSLRRMRISALDTATGSALVMWMVIAGLAGSHITALALNGPQTVLGDATALLRIWDGMSSFGGLFVGAAAGVWFLVRRGVSGQEIRAYLDAVAYVFPIAWIFGRAGCSIAHDHPGIRSTNILAVRYPDGSRFDAGLLELLAVIPIAVLFLALGKHRRAPGFYLATLFVLYGPVRFLIDSIRIGEVRYLGLTTGQYGAGVTTLIGLAMLLLWAGTTSSERKHGRSSRSSIHRSTRSSSRASWNESSMTDQPSIASLRSQARIAGFLYLIIIVAGGVGYTMHSTLFVWNDAAATAGNIRASEQLWRLSFAAMLVMLACDVAVAAIFYVLFMPVNRTLSLIACAFRLVLVAIVGVAILGRYMPLLLLKDTASAAFESDQLQAMGLLSIKMFERGFDVALVFFGFHCLAIGWLIYRSSFLPRFLGVLLLIAGLCYLISTFVNLVFPVVALPFDIQLLSYVAEMALCLWLIVIGVNAERWKEQASAA
jgi:prolipoprotein diacylglyceryltransferase